LRVELHQVLTARDPGDTVPPLKLNICLFSCLQTVRFSFSDSRAANAIAYKNDRLDAAASGVAFARGFLKVADFINQTEARCQQRLHLTAHSMGNYVLRHALQELKRQVGNQLPRLFDQVLMMAADEDDDAFDSRLQIVVSVPHHLVQNQCLFQPQRPRSSGQSDQLKGNTARLGTDCPIQPRQLPRNVYPIDCTLLRFSSFTDPFRAWLLSECPPGLSGICV
jgi:esterase/lipase superfamily enzyme